MQVEGVFVCEEEDLLNALTRHEAVVTVPAYTFSEA
jgi:hypothetical protein